MSFDLASLFGIGEVDYIKISFQALKDIFEKNNKCITVVKENDKVYVKIDLICTGLIEVVGEDIVVRLPKKGK
jgi:hypothetical protein